MSPRDTQKTKLYRAEDLAFGAERRASGSEPQMSIAELEAYYRKVLASPWTQKHFRLAALARVWIRDGRGTRIARGGLSSLNMPRWARNRWILLHEIAHALTPRRYAGHGREYAANYLKLVRHFEGKEAHDKLRDAFRAGNVRYKPKRQLSPETLEQLRESGRRLAARAAKPE